MEEISTAEEPIETEETETENAAEVSEVEDPTKTEDAADAANTENDDSEIALELPQEISEIDMQKTISEDESEDLLEIAGQEIKDTSSSETETTEESAEDSTAKE